MLIVTGADPYTVRMSAAKTDNDSRTASSIVVPIVLAVLAGLAVYFARGYGATASRLPTLIGSIVFVLALLDFVSRLPGAPGRVLRLTLGAGFQERELDFEPRRRTEIMQLAWVPAVIVAIIVVGILITLPVFVFLYSWLNGRWPAWLCALTAVVVTALVGIVFEVVLDYELYRGMLFGDEAYL